MPNWCEGNLTVNGPEEARNRFFQRARSNSDGGKNLLEADNFIPYPDKYKELDRKRKEWDEEHPGDWKNAPKDGFNNGGYDWCCDNWDTKWGFCEVVLQGRYPLAYRFSTAWSPIAPVIVKMGEEFPELEFVYEYEEEGMGFAGKLVIRDGVVIERSNWDVCEEYNNEEEEDD